MSIQARRAETAEAEGSGAAEPAASEVDRDILDSLTGLVKHVGVAATAIARGFGIAPHDLLAIFKLDGPLSMKEMAQRMGCDASFITSVADTLEEHGYVRREASLRDRRVKNLVLTPAGIAAKERLMTELAVRMPWRYALDAGERQCFLGLLRKMADARPSEARAPEAGPAPEVNGTNTAGSRTRSD